MCCCCGSPIVGSGSGSDSSAAAADGRGGGDVSPEALMWGTALLSLNAGGSGRSVSASPLPIAPAVPAAAVGRPPHTSPLISTSDTILCPNVFSCTPSVVSAWKLLSFNGLSKVTAVDGAPRQEQRVLLLMSCMRFAAVLTSYSQATSKLMTVKFGRNHPLSRSVVTAVCMGQQLLKPQRCALQMARASAQRAR